MIAIDGPAGAGKSTVARGVAAAQAERDRRDSDREHGALRTAADAVEIDTTGLTVSRVVQRIVEVGLEQGVLA